MGFVFLIVAVLIYFLPALVAQHRGRDGLLLIALLNALLGWTVLGWLVLLVVAFTGESRKAREHRDRELELLREIARRDKP